MYKHLKENEVAPELHLTRWLRCVLSREYSIETCLLMWDFIFAGIAEGGAESTGYKAAGQGG